ncbi:cytochrome P450 315a1, mitochondrial [Anopheles marshallii]|uniref:cytochrome P450 315a1, mitochondrial n=1 Tax=Anopheles marshallii TaxID=1521116 RepID=UPI00237BCD46|nr:cytochrome P450 315a1, mitochondrial [Anopheles marshallii]
MLCRLRSHNIRHLSLLELSSKKQLMARSNRVGFASGNALPFIKIPGPRRLPLLGMLNDIMHLGKPAELHLRISKYHELYGDLVRLQIGTQNAVFVRDPQLMRKTFQLEGPYPRHPLPESWTYFNKKHDYQRGLFFMDGREWLQARQIFNKPMLKDFNWMELPIRGTCAATVEHIKQNCDDTFVFDGIEAFLYQWSVEVVLSVMLGASFPKCQQSPEFRQLVAQFSSVVYDIFRFSSELMNIPPAIADRLNVQPWQQFEKVVPETIRLATDIIEFGIANSQSNDGLLDLMVQKLDKPLMMRIFIDFIIAAGDTTSFATVWALYLLANNPTVQESVRENIRESNTLECTAVKGVVRETLRLYPVAPFIGRFLEDECSFGEYLLPKDTLVLLSLYSAGRDERFFIQPNQFNPYRWQRNTATPSNKVGNTASASLPFAIGARSCIGQKIAQLQMHYLISMMLTNFEVGLAEKDQQESIKPILKMITVPNMPVKVSFKAIQTNA